MLLLHTGCYVDLPLLRADAAGYALSVTLWLLRH